MVTRECLEHEEGFGDWGLVYPQFQRIELRGEVRRGYFVAGLPGIQFALPEAVEMLRGQSESDEMIVLNAADPANVFGGELSDVPLRFARVPSTHVVLFRGQPVLVFEEGGERITTLPGLTPDSARRALQAYFARPNASRRVVVARWNGVSVLKSDGQPLLEGLGFSRAPNGMERWATR